MSWQKDLQANLRTSQDLVSTFFLIKTPEDADRAIAKLKLLVEKGVSEDYIDTISSFVSFVYRSEYRHPEREFQQSLIFFFRPEVSTERLRSFLWMKRIPEQGIEIEVGVPGFLAANFPEFFDNGFWTAFMPPGYYQ